MVTAALITIAVIAVALINKGGPTAPSKAGSPTSTAAASPSTSTNDADSSTCLAWQSTASALDQIQELPDGWDWDTSGIDDMIARRDAALGKAMDLFEPHIAPAPADVAAAAHEYVNSRRQEMQKLQAHTYTQSDGVAGNVALARLNQLCHTTGDK